MSTLQTDVLVIGGGATGAAVAWDCALRGYETVLVDRADLAMGTSGRFHGLLHSGGRYAVKDPRSAHECMSENTILRKVAADAIEDSGGMFVTTPDDDPAYGDEFLAGCLAAGIPAREIAVAEALRAEPRLNPGLRRAFTVPDAGVDAWKLVWGFAHGVQSQGGTVLPYHRVEAVLREGDTVTGARMVNELTGEEVTVEAAFTLNASGAWAGKLADLAGCEGVRVLAGKGIMIAMNHRLVNTVINRCMMPGDGDILVPIRTVSVIGTTDIKSDEPDELEVTQAEVDAMLDDGERLVPGFRDARALRVWAGVRPLFSDEKADVDDTRDVSRSHTLLDHAERDGVSGFLTITGGKLTTCRLMAQDTVDAMVAQRGDDRPCRTHEVTLPDSAHGASYELGRRLRAREEDLFADQLVCECELITRARLEETMRDRATANLDDVRRSLRLGMGPCQGGFCIYRATGILHGVERLNGPEANGALQGFLEERWKGVWPILYGDQLRQARLDDWIFQGLLDVEHLPDGDASASARGIRERNEAGPDGPGEEALDGADPAVEAARGSLSGAAPRPGRPPGGGPAPGGGGGVSPDAVGVGTGLAGLTAAVRLAESGRRVLVLAKGIGSTHLSSGCVDVLGYVGDERVAAPGGAIGRLGPDHPYARVGGAAAVRESLAWFQQHFPAPYAYAGSLEENWLLPTAVGAFKPTALLPATMAAGDLRSDAPMCIVSFRALRDFHPAYAADNLTRGGVPARGITLELPLGRRPDENALGMARRFDDPAFRAEVAAALAGRLEPEERVGFPAGLGAADAATAWSEMEDRLERPVFEIPTLPPSVPGIRLYRVLEAALKRAGGRIIVNSEVLSFDGDVVRAQAAGRAREYRTAWLVLATGGFASGGLELDAHWRARETVLGLPLTGVPADGDRRFGPRYFGEQPMARAGVAVDDGLRPLGADGERAWENVLVVGGALAGAASWKEKSGDGIALASGHRAAGLIAGAGEPVAGAGGGGGRPGRRRRGTAGPGPAATAPRG